MTIERIEQLIHAYNEGKTIEYMHWMNKKWYKLDLSNIRNIANFTDGNYEFRIKGVESIEYNFKPFDKVLVRDNKDSYWTCSLFSYVKPNDYYPYHTISSCYKICIPFEGNESLVGTKDDV